MRCLRPLFHYTLPSTVHMQFISDQPYTLVPRPRGSRKRRAPRYHVRPDLKPHVDPDLSHRISGMFFPKKHRAQIFSDITHLWTQLIGKRSCVAQGPTHKKALAKAEDERRRNESLGNMRWAAENASVRCFHAHPLPLLAGALFELANLLTN